MCCPATYIAIFRSHIHINAIFWWLAVAVLPTKTTLNKESADWGSEPPDMGILQHEDSSSAQVANTQLLTCTDTSAGQWVVLGRQGQGGSIKDKNHRTQGQFSA